MFSFVRSLVRSLAVSFVSCRFVQPTFVRLQQQLLLPLLLSTLSRYTIARPGRKKEEATWDLIFISVTSTTSTNLLTYL